MIRLRVLPAVAVLAFAGLAPATAAEGGCLSSGDMSEAVAAKRVVAPGEALVLARRAVPNADILRASLCREPETLVYRITALRHDGRLVRVTLDAPSGRVKAVH